MVSGRFEVSIVYWHMIPADQLNATGTPSHKNPFRLQVRHTDNGTLSKMDNVRCHADKASLYNALGECFNSLPPQLIAGLFASSP